MLWGIYKHKIKKQKQNQPTNQKKHYKYPNYKFELFVKPVGFNDHEKTLPYINDVRNYQQKTMIRLTILMMILLYH